MKQIYSTAEARRLHTAALVRKEIMRHPAKTYRLNLLSKKYRIDKTTMSHAFKQAYGISIFQFVKAQRIVLAKHLLRNQELPVKAIARDCGYTDVKHFSTVFKDVVGVTPSAFRKEYLKLADS